MTVTLRSDAAGFTRHVVDGQTLYFPDDATIDALLEHRTLDGRPIASHGRFERFVRVTRRAPSFHVALGEERAPAKPWIVYHVVFLDDGPCRVLAESQTCFACGAASITGNPCDYQTFVGVDDPLAAMMRASARPLRPCPRCGTRFPRPTVWVVAG